VRHAWSQVPRQDCPRACGRSTSPKHYSCTAAPTSGPSPENTSTCPWQLKKPSKRLATNLVHNAIVHNLPEQGTVWVTTSALPDSVVLTVENTGEAVATAVFGCWFLTCLLLAVRAIRRDDVVNHRRWMIHAFAVGIAVGTIRVWIGLLIASGLLTFTTASPRRFGLPSVCM
jgi:uncharacterized membrane protein